MFRSKKYILRMAGIDQVIRDYRAEIVGGTGPDIGAVRDSSGYQRIWVSHYRTISPAGYQGMETIKTISSPGYLDSHLSILQTTIAPSDWHTSIPLDRARSDTSHSVHWQR